MKASKRKKTAVAATAPWTCHATANATKSQSEAGKPVEGQAEGMAGQASAQAPRVYSYSRFSSKEQADGDSERRQWEAAQRYAKEHGMKLDETLRMVDRGLSGRGTHRAKGAFGVFLHEVEAGKVPRGSILLVENLDRLSREDILTAFETVSKLIRAGIKIVTLAPRAEYTVESLNGGQIYMLIGIIQRAHDESEIKSKRIKESWESRRKFLNPERLITGKAPAWLDIKADKQGDRVVRHGVKVNKAAADCIRQIFRMKIEGFSKTAIAAHLNQQQAWCPPKERNQKTEGWRESYIEKILRSRSVLGEYQPHVMQMDEGKGKQVRVPIGEPRKDYYPRVIDDNTFYAVQKLFADNSKLSGNGGGRTGKATNVFQYLVRCGYCGGPMVLIDKGAEPKGGKYLICDTGRRGVVAEDGERKCRAHSVRYKEFELTMLSSLRRLKPEAVLPNEDERSRTANTLKLSIASEAGKVVELEKQVANIRAQQRVQMMSQENREYWETCLEDIQKQRDNAKAQQTKLEAELIGLGQTKQSFDRWQRDINGLKEAIKGDIGARLRLRSHLKEFIERVDIFARGHPEDLESAVAACDEMFEGLRFKRPGYNGLLNFLEKRILSPEGRCYRLFLKTIPKTAPPAPKKTKRQKKRSKRKKRNLVYSKRVVAGTNLPVAPADSLASSIELTEDTGQRHRFPALVKLLEEFYDGRRPGQFVPKGKRR